MFCELYLYYEEVKTYYRRYQLGRTDNEIINLHHAIAHTPYFLYVYRSIYVCGFGNSILKTNKDCKNSALCFRYMDMKSTFFKFRCLHLNKLFGNCNSSPKYNGAKFLVNKKLQDKKL